MLCLLLLHTLNNQAKEKIFRPKFQTLVHYEIHVMNTNPKRVRSSGLKYWTQAKTKSIVVNLVTVSSMVQENLLISSKKKKMKKP